MQVRAISDNVASTLPRFESWGAGELPPVESESERARHVRDVIDPARAAALHATLGAGGEAPRAGTHLPPFWHHIYFWDCVPEQGLGRDGHPQTGGLIPDTGFPHRMWAGGTVRWCAPAIVGLEAEKSSAVVRCENKAGRSGAFALVTLKHEIRQNGLICISETQDLIYRAEKMRWRQAPEPEPAPTDETRSRSHRFSTVTLFRYSAVTFNGHRIHYDPDFARTHGGYPGLVVHGPLLALLLTQFAKEILGTLSCFSFRATSPVTQGETIETCARDDSDRLSLWIRGPDGRLCMSAEAFPAPLA